jgi:predicted DNA-binding transcriptional regulator YafY
MRLIITYKSFKSSKVIDYDISPYFLKRYNQRWFLFAQVAGFDSLTNLALDRIEIIDFSSTPFTPNTKYDWDEYFDDMIGVSRPQNTELTKIQLKFTPDQAPYIKKKPLHGSQKTISENEEGLIIQIEVIPNYELESLVLSFGSDCEVLAPIEFQYRIIKRKGL